MVSESRGSRSRRTSAAIVRQKNQGIAARLRTPAGNSRELASGTHAGNSRKETRAQRDLEIAGVPISSPDRLLFPAAKLTKLDLIRYYEAVGDWILPHLEGRPLTLKQCAPDVDHCRYLRHSGERAPANVRVIAIQEQTKVGDYMIVDNLAGLISLAQRNIIELHTWNSTADHLETPDRMVFDLDPGPLVEWRDTVAAGHQVRKALEGVGLKAWVKTTGGQGLHIVVPIVPEHDWSDCLALARAFASEMAEHDPRRFTTKFAKRGRERQILIDYLRNNRTNTSIAAYAARARAGATVSVPITWEELTPRLRPERWTMRTVPKLLASRKDPWAAYFRTRQSLRI
jgi:bifunctional non-homologous end joining protein LigD